ncbi:uncharacterized protein LY79DRAFT_670534 [Colletotrichum navitas]|uniref:Uncharacterized protein n=1 Tax=Colletotrichum navitas TaxID=681940 RepID=A0AAD8V3N9_9PEZI|nr:uncharacterized protein LY79DRAFT_670534 [Colletotrichum navitas]KAK1586088.1 hypothetical protein LY79DRAFT_670534 [Colletotrichum navitas]
MRGLYIGLGAVALVSVNANQYPNCEHDNCYNNLIDDRFKNEANVFCVDFLDGTTTALSAIPTDFANCDSIKAASSACSCVTYTLTHTVPVTTSTPSFWITSTTAPSTTYIVYYVIYNKHFFHCQQHHILKQQYIIYNLYDKEHFSTHTLFKWHVDYHNLHFFSNKHLINCHQQHIVYYLQDKHFTRHQQRQRLKHHSNHFHFSYLGNEHFCGFFDEHFCGFFDEHSRNFCDQHSRGF